MRIVHDSAAPHEGGRIGRVSHSASGGFGVVGASRISSALVFAPRGISYLPAVGDNVLLMPVEGSDTCIGVLSTTSGLSPGELRLTSSGGATITLRSNGEIDLNGAIITRDGRVISR